MSSGKPRTIPHQVAQAHTHTGLALWLGASLSDPCLASRFRSPFPLLDLTMKRFAIPSAAALLMVFAGCSSMQSAANTTDIELVLATPPS